MSSLSTAGAGLQSAAAKVLLNQQEANVIRQNEVAALMTFDVESAFLDFSDKQQRCRPFLVLMGRPTMLEGEFPFNIRTIRYQNPDDKALMAYRYDLSRRNLAELAEKGLFEQGFDVPSIIQNNEFQLPCTVSCGALGPQGPDDVPIIFASVDTASLHCTDETSGYDISSYFESLPEEEVTEQLDPSRGLPESGVEAVLEQVQHDIDTVMPSKEPDVEPEYREAEEPVEQPQKEPEKAVGQQHRGAEIPDVAPDKAGDEPEYI